MQILAELVRADPDLRPRLTGMVGTDYSRSPRRLPDIVLSRWLEPLLLARRQDTYPNQEPESEMAERLFLSMMDDVFEAEFAVVTIVPIFGLVIPEPVALLSNVELRRLNDSEVSTCLMAGLPSTPGPIAGSLDVAEHHRSALVVTEHLPVRTEESTESRPPPAWPGMAGRLTTALRLVLGGRLAPGQAIRWQHDPVGWDRSTARTGEVITVPAEGTSVVLDVRDRSRLLALLDALLSPVVVGRGNMGTALTRIRNAPLRSDDADSLIDLMIACEALLLDADARGIGKALAHAAGQACEGLPGLKAEEVRSFVRAAYRTRSEFVHGSTPSPARRLDGTLASSVRQVAEDADRLMRQLAEAAVLKLAAGSATPVSALADREHPQ